MVKAQKDNEREQRWPSAMIAIPPRLNPLRKSTHLPHASVVVTMLQFVVALSYWKKDRK